MSNNKEPTFCYGCFCEGKIVPWDECDEKHWFSYWDRNLTNKEACKCKGLPFLYKPWSVKDLLLLIENKRRETENKKQKCEETLKQCDSMLRKLHKSK